MRHLAQDIAALLSPGDLVALSGALGVGKSVVAREIVRYRASDPDLAVPSPTFPLRIDYHLPGFTVIHADLYRLHSPDDVLEIGLDEAIQTAALLVEWPDQLPEMGDVPRLSVTISEPPPHENRPPTSDLKRRIVTITANGGWFGRIIRFMAARKLIAESGWGDAERHNVAGDVSSRTYRRLVQPGKSTILMDSPPRIEGSPDVGGRSFEAVTRRAMDIRPFVAIAGALRARGFSAPNIAATDLTNGLALLEDFGTQTLLDDNRMPIAVRYGAAIDMLAAMHGVKWPSNLTLPDGTDYPVPPYNLPAYLAEIALFADWYAGKSGRIAMDPRTRAAFLEEWANILRPLAKARESWVMLDFHSPNIMWLADHNRAVADADERLPHERIGILDFQDTLRGHCAYDVASLALDARALVSVELERALIHRYVAARIKNDSNFDPVEFGRAYAILGAQRLTKVLGAFSRLTINGKAGYKGYIPIAEQALKRCLTDPALHALGSYYKDYIVTR